MRNEYLKVFIMINIFLFMLMLNLFGLALDYINCSKLTFFFLNLLSILALVLVNIIRDGNLEIYVLFVLVWLGALIVICSDHLFLVYLGLELQSFSSFVLISSNRSSIKSSEAGIKYFILGAFSSGLYLLGSYFLFINSLSLKIEDIILFCDSIFLFFGFIMIFVSLIFKIGLAPLHFWIPDVYEGSNWNVISLIGTLPKISLLYIIISITSLQIDLLFFCGLLSILFGTIGAFNQSKLKRLLGYSGISHMGFIVLGICIMNIIGLEICIIYLIIYAFSSLLLFVLALNDVNSGKQYIIDLAEIKTRNKILGITWILIFLSIGGIPPLSGFLSKWLIIWQIIEYNHFLTSLIIVIFSIIGLGYYLRIAQIIFFQKNSSYLVWNSIFLVLKYNNIRNTILLGSLLFFVIFLIINPDPLMLLVNYSIFD